MTNEKEIVLFETEDKKITFPVEVKDETVWLSVSQMAQLFDREESNIMNNYDFVSIQIFYYIYFSLHIKILLS